MPGIYGLITHNKTDGAHAALFRDIDSNLFVNKWTKKTSFSKDLNDSRLSIGISSLKQGWTNPEKTDPSGILFEGYLYEISGVSRIPHEHDSLTTLLNNLYKEKGCGFLDDLYGSFSLVIIDNGSVSLVTDQTGSRPIYIYRSNSVLAWTPEIFPLIRAFKNDLTYNRRNIAQILCSEFSFIDDTIVNEITCLRPGEKFTYMEKECKRDFYFRFRYNSGNMESPRHSTYELAEKINNRIMQVIERQWAMAPSPAIMLSGGLDSRYVLSRIAEIVEDTTKLNLVTWTIPDSSKYSDLDIAKRIAERLGARHIILERKPGQIPENIDEMFRLIGCEVDTFFHVHEKLLVEELREKYGFESLFRGEESFGWGEYRRNLKYALNQIIVSCPEDNPLLKKIFRPDQYDRIVSSWHLKLNEILKEFKQSSVNDTKDVLYFNWRLSRYLDTLSYYKLAYLEQFNPLLDFDVLKINCITPSRSRVDKKIFRKAYSLIENSLKNIPFATRNSLERWEHTVFHEKDVYQYVKTNLARENAIFQDSSALLDASYFENKPVKIDEEGIIDSIKFSPIVKNSPIFKGINKLRHFFVKPPPHTVMVKLIFRTAIVKDFLYKYFK